MKKYTSENLDELFAGIAEIFTEKKDELCELDAKMGDGDLGLTMHKGYGAVPDLIRDNNDTSDLGAILVKTGMKMSSIVPSTMGTLMSSGIMQGGKALKGKTEMGPQELATYLEAFAQGVQKRGKCSLGDRTILDALHPAGQAAVAAAEQGKSIEEVITEAHKAAQEGVENTKNMLPKFGKAAVFSAKALGVADQGAIAGMYMIEGLKRAICR